MVLELLERFQTSLVGVLGFTGVILTMVVNARTQRNLQAAQREHKVRSLRTALLVELKTNVQMYETRISDFSKADGTHHALIPSKVTNNIYHSSLPDIGLLSENEVSAVLRAYLLIEEMPYRLRLLVGTDKVGGYSDEFIIIDAGTQQAAQKVHEALLLTLGEAVAVLGRNA
ncbi:hypothetical protein GALL_519230 [mine drainage metagenome]|uniref:Uncharacterized protein n=1 Tax=mine drainage metagenome TaxID=410659 RepID=A0A1J5P5N9_9ZZZZ